MEASVDHHKPPPGMDTGQQPDDSDVEAGKRPGIGQPSALLSSSREDLHSNDSDSGENMMHEMVFYDAMSEMSSESFLNSPAFESALNARFESLFQKKFGSKTEYTPKFEPDEFESKLERNSELEETYKKEGFEMDSQPKHKRNSDSLFLVPERSDKIKNNYQAKVKYPPEHYPRDSYSFIALGPGKRVAFFLGCMVFFIQFSILTLLFFSKTYFFVPEWRPLSQNEEIDNPDQDSKTSNFGGFMPANTSVIVRMTQVLMIVVFVVLGGDSVKDLTRSLMHFPLIRFKYRWLQFSCFLRGFQGLLGIATVILLMVTSNDVIDIILNFTAVHYISNFDDIAFSLAESNLYGTTLKEAAEHVKKKRLPDCILKLKNHICYHYLYLIVIGTLGSLFMSLTVAIIAAGERDDVWATGMLRVGFKDENLQRYSGCFKATEFEHNRRMAYKSFRSRDGANASLAYCQDKHEWIFHAGGPEENPCKVDEDGRTLSHSSITFSFDISTVFDTLWFSQRNEPLTVSFFENEQNEDTEDFFFCGSYQNDGVCDAHLNIPEFQYDGGDCCSSTCSKNNTCGKNLITGPFGIDNITGFGYPSCEDPELQSLRIHIDEISGLEEVKVQELNLVCQQDASDDDRYRVFSVPLSLEMVGRNDTIRLNAGAICSLEIQTKGASRSTASVDYHVVQMFIDSAADGVKTYKGNTKSGRFFTYSSELDQLRLEWSISSSVIELELLTDLNLRNKGLSGLIPRAVRLMPSLTRLDLSDNSLTGPIPSELGLLTSLTRLFLYDNALTGTIPSEIGLMTSLDLLYLWNNLLTGPIPSEIGLLTSLRRLDLPYNALTGTIPSEIGLMTSLTRLSLHDNALTGTIPREIGLITSLTDVYLHNNALTGPIPSEIGRMTSLAMLFLYNNTLTGTIPSDIGRMTSLTELSLRNNLLTGTIPSEIGVLNFLRYLYLWNNLLTGPIPSEIELLTSLRRLDLHNNALTGPIPSEIGLLTSLSYLYLGNNTFDGTVPVEIEWLTSRLVDYNFDSCCLG